MKVEDVMTREVITARPDATLAEVARLMIRHHVDSIPIVDEQNRVRGMITKGDLFPKRRLVPFSVTGLPALFEQWVSPAELLNAYRAARSRPVSQVMTRAVLTVDAADELKKVVFLMAERNIKRIPVLREGKLAGIVTRSDVIRFLMGEI